MNLSEKILISGAAYLLMQSYVFGIIKYRQMMASNNSNANYYVNMSHNAPILYIAASLLLAVFARLSLYPDYINVTAAASIVAFYIIANVNMSINAFKGVNYSVLRKIKRNGESNILLVHLYICLLVTAQFGGSIVLVSGGVLGVWQAH